MCVSCELGAWFLECDQKVSFALLWDKTWNLQYLGFDNRKIAHCSQTGHGFCCVCFVWMWFCCSSPASNPFVSPYCSARLRVCFSKNVKTRDTNKGWVLRWWAHWAGRTMRLLTNWGDTKELLLFVDLMLNSRHTERETPCSSHLGSKLGGHLKAWQYQLGSSFWGMQA